MFHMQICIDLLLLDFQCVQIEGVEKGEGDNVCNFGSTGCISSCCWCCNFIFFSSAEGDACTVYLIILFYFLFISFFQTIISVMFTYECVFVCGLFLV